MHSKFTTKQYVAVHTTKTSFVTIERKKSDGKKRFSTILPVISSWTYGKQNLCSLECITFFVLVFYLKPAAKNSIHIFLALFWRVFWALKQTNSWYGHANPLVRGHSSTTWTRFYLVCTSLEWKIVNILQTFQPLLKLGLFTDHLPTFSCPLSYWMTNKYYKIFVSQCQNCV